MIRQVSHLAWKKPALFLYELAVLCVWFLLSCWCCGVLGSPITVTNCHTVSNIQLLTYLSSKCASSNSSTNLWVLRETRSCLALLFWKQSSLFWSFTDSRTPSTLLLHAVHFCCLGTQRAVWRVEQFLMAPPGTDVIDINVELLICSWGIVCKLT